VQVFAVTLLAVFMHSDNSAV